MNTDAAAARLPKSKSAEAPDPFKGGLSKRSRVRRREPFHHEALRDFQKLVRLRATIYDFHNFSCAHIGFQCKNGALFDKGDRPSRGRTTRGSPNVKRNKKVPDTAYKLLKTKETA